MSAITATSSYALDSAWHAERDRLNSITQLYDPGTLEACRRIGVGAGWRCLDAGAGTGSVAEALSAIVGPAGTVTALDADTRFLEPLASEQLQVTRADLIADELPDAAYDLVHARLVLEHLTTRDAVLGKLVAATAPGGWLLIEDFDWATALMVDPPSSLHDKVAAAIRDVFTGHGYDSAYGRSLPRRLRAAGLIEVTTRAEAIQVWADGERGVPQWELLARQLAPAMLAQGRVSESELDAFARLWHDGDTVCFSPVMVSCWGRRPAG